MTTREAFLQRVREAVAAGNRPGEPGKLPPRGAFGYQGAGPDPVRTFAEQLIALGGACHLVAEPANAVAKVIELLRQASANKVLVGKGLPDRLGLADALRAERLEVWDECSAERNEQTKQTLFAADAGVTGVDWLIGETGTMVVTTREGQGRSLSLLPPLHIAVATREQLLPDLFDFFPLSPLGERGRGEGVELPATSEKTPSRPTPLPQGGEGRTSLPACVTLITGPSKTGDIELRLVTGVHGPGEVHVVLMTSSPPGRS